MGGPGVRAWWWSGVPGGCGGPGGANGRYGRLTWMEPCEGRVKEAIQGRHGGMEDRVKEALHERESDGGCPRLSANGRQTKLARPAVWARGEGCEAAEGGGSPPGVSLGGAAALKQHYVLISGPKWGAFGIPASFVRSDAAVFFATVALLVHLPGLEGGVAVSVALLELQAQPLTKPRLTTSAAPPPRGRAPAGPTCAARGARARVAVIEGPLVGRGLAMYGCDQDPKMWLKRLRKV
jgi:hypothetical protein